MVSITELRHRGKIVSFANVIVTVVLENMQFVSKLLEQKMKTFVKKL